MYTANDIKRRIEEIHYANHLNQMDVIEKAVKQMYDFGWTSIEFSITEDYLEGATREEIEKAGFATELINDGLYRLYIAGEE